MEVLCLILTGNSRGASGAGQWKHSPPAPMASRPQLSIMGRQHQNYTDQKINRNPRSQTSTFILKFNVNFVVTLMDDFAPLDTIAAF